jgi:hypothetical protein
MNFTMHIKKKEQRNKASKVQLIKWKSMNLITGMHVEKKEQIIEMQTQQVTSFNQTVLQSATPKQASGETGGKRERGQQNGRMMMFPIKSSRE